MALAGDVSSQFITALMLVGPVLDGGLRIELTTPLVSRPYVALTASVMGAFGAEVEVSERTIVVAPGRYRAAEFAIEPDASSASYPMAVAALRAVPVTVAGLHPPLAQGDGAIVGLLEAMGCTVTTDERGTTVARDASSPLRRHRRRHGRRVGPRAHGGRRRRGRDDADDRARGAASSGPRRATASATSPPS